MAGLRDLTFFLFFKLILLFEPESDKNKNKSQKNLEICLKILLYYWLL